MVSSIACCCVTLICSSQCGVIHCLLLCGIHLQQSLWCHPLPAAVWHSSAAVTVVSSIACCCVTLICSSHCGVIHCLLLCGIHLQQSLLQQLLLDMDGLIHRNLKVTSWWLLNSRAESRLKKKTKLGNSHSEKTHLSNLQFKNN